MMELNHSNRSDIYQDRELLEAVLQKVEEPQCLNESGGSRLSAILPLRSNGNLSRPSSFISKRSVTISQEKLSDVTETIIDKDDCSNKELLTYTLHVLSLICVCSLILGALAIQLLIALSSQQTVLTSRETLVGVNVTFVDVTEVATALTTFVIVLNVTCLLLCSLQCLVVVKLLKVHMGDDRALKYLKDCSSSRLIAVTGFFVSIPAFLIAVILYIVLRFTSTAAITATVILVVGIIFSILSLIQNCYHWRIEQSRAADGLPVFGDTSIRYGVKENIAGKELSTLV